MIDLTEIKYRLKPESGYLIRYTPLRDIQSILEYIKSKGYTDLKVNGKAVK